jgi:hypothetical protein
VEFRLLGPIEAVDDAALAHGTALTPDERAALVASVVVAARR